jgi:hypothetical protein
MTKSQQITKAQLAALHVYAEYLRTSDGGLTHRPAAVRRGTHRALLKKGLLEVADAGELRYVQHTYGYNFGRIRITKSHLESTARFRLTAAGLAAVAK